MLLFDTFQHNLIVRNLKGQATSGTPDPTSGQSNAQLVN